MSMRQLLRNESAEALGDMLMTFAVVVIITIGVVLFMVPDVSGWRLVGLWIGGAALVIALLVITFFIQSVFEGRSDKKRLGPLCYAAREGKLNQVHQLLQEGADVNARRDGGSTALIDAALAGRTDIVNALLAQGAEVNLTDDAGLTALSAAALGATGSSATKGGLAYLVSALIAKGANVNVVDNHGLTALMREAINGNVTNVKILVGAGADINVRINNGTTALEFATDRNHTEVVDLLKKAGAKE